MRFILREPLAKWVQPRVRGFLARKKSKVRWRAVVCIQTFARSALAMRSKARALHFRAQVRSVCARPDYEALETGLVRAQAIARGDSVRASHRIGKVLAKMRHLRTNKFDNIETAAVYFICTLLVFLVLLLVCIFVIVLKVLSKSYNAKQTTAKEEILTVEPSFLNSCLAPEETKIPTGAVALFGKRCGLFGRRITKSVESFMTNVNTYIHKLDGFDIFIWALALLPFFFLA